MNRIKIVTLMVIALTGLTSVHAQSVDEIINKFVEANGGKERMAGVKSLYTEGELDFMGNKGPSVTYMVNGKGFKNEIDFNGQKIVSCYTDKGSWTINPMAGQVVATEVPEESARIGRLQLDIVGPLFQYASKGHKIELMGQEDVKGSNAYKLKVMTPEKIEVFYWLDSKTYYIVKSVTKISVNGEEMEMTYVFSDQKKTDYGLIMPFLQELTFPGLTFVTTSKKMEFNKAIDTAIFVMPKS
jgi:hypothetical protein